MNILSMIGFQERNWLDQKTFEEYDVLFLENHDGFLVKCVLFEINQFLKEKEQQANSNSQPQISNEIPLNF